MKKKGSLLLIIVVMSLLLLTACNGGFRKTFPPLTMPENINPHRTEVYTNGFPNLAINMNVPINWDSSTASLQSFRDNWHGATLNVTNTSSQFAMNNVTISARGRGNSTWRAFGGTKRPIRFRFPNNQWQSMFDSDHVGRDWVLFANTIDPSHLRNFSAFYFGQLLDSMHFVPDMWFVNLYLDNRYRGVYLLADEREAIEGRANLALNIDPTISEYMIEFDFRVQNSASPVNTHWVRNRTGSFGIRYPSTSDWMSIPNNPHALYVERFLNNVDSAILRGNQEQIESIIDVETFVDFYIVNELMRTIDISFSSVFYQIRGQNENRRLYAGPLWDFDFSAGSGSYPDGGAVDVTRGPYVAVHHNWFNQLLNHTPWFRDEVKNRWLEVRDTEVQQLLDRVAYMALTFETEFQRDINRWPRHGNHVRNSPVVRGLRTALENAEFLHWWLIERASWMDDWLGVTSQESTRRSTAKQNQTHAVAVINGTGSGNFESDTVVKITANIPAIGYEFSHWKTDVAIEFANPKTKTTTFKMPASDITVEAAFKEISKQPYTLTIINGTGNFNLAQATVINENNNPKAWMIEIEAQTIVEIVANTPGEGYEFSHWKASAEIEFTDHKAKLTTFEMPTSNLTIEAIFKPLQKSTITVISGTGIANFELENCANDCTLDSRKSQMNVDTNIKTQNCANDCTIDYWTIEVNVGTIIKIIANHPDEGYEFSHWTADTKLEFADYQATVTTFKTSPEDVIIKAIFKPIQAHPEVDVGDPGKIINEELALKIKKIEKELKFLGKTC